jgi:hypothetical protein
MCRRQFVSLGYARDKVVALDEILPAEPFGCASLGSARDRQGRPGVPRLGRRGRKVEAQRVGVVLAQEVGHLHSGATTLA